MKTVHLCAALALACVVLTAGPAFAAAVSDTRVSVPYGDAAASAVSMLGDAAWIAIVAVLSRFAGPVWGAMRIARLDQLLERSLKGVFEKHADDLRGKAITVDVKNRVIAEAARTAIAQGNAALINWAGSNTIQDKLLARWSDTLADWLTKQK